MKNSTDQLTCTVSPQTVYISTNPNQSSYANIVVTVTNAGAQAASVSSIAITLPTALTLASTAGSIVPVAPADNSWDFSASQITTGEFDATPQNGDTVPLAAGGAWQFALNMVTLNNSVVPSSAAVTAVIQFTDGSTSGVINLNVSIAAAVAAIKVFNSQPADINPGQTANLNWQCTDIDHCIISPVGSGQLGASGTLQISPEATTIYTLYAYGAGVILSAQWAVSVENPQIIKFGGRAGQSSVDYNGSITLVWACNQFTNSIGIVSDTGVPIPALMTGSNTPQKGSISVGPVLGVTSFTLTAYGQNTANFVTSVAEINITDVTASLTASPNSNIWQKDAVVLSWQTSSAISVSLSPAVTNGPSAQNPNGSVTIYPEQDVTYTLTATGFKGNSPITLTRLVSLSVTPVSISSFEAMPPIICPDLTLNQVQLICASQAQVASINGVGSVNPTGNTMVDQPANGSVYTLTAGTTQNPAMVTKTVPVVNACGPYNFTAEPQVLSYGFVTIQNPDLLKYVTTGATYEVLLTGLVVKSGSMPSPCYAEFTDFGTGSFCVLNAGADLNYDWADPNKQAGTITILKNSKTVYPSQVTFNQLPQSNLGFSSFTMPIPSFMTANVPYYVEQTGLTVATGDAPPYYFALYAAGINRLFLAAPGNPAFKWADPAKQNGNIVFLGLAPSGTAEEEVLNMSPTQVNADIAALREFAQGMNESDDGLHW